MSNGITTARKSGGFIYESGILSLQRLIPSKQCLIFGNCASCPATFRRNAFCIMPAAQVPIWPASIDLHKGQQFILELSRAFTFEMCITTDRTGLRHVERLVISAGQRCWRGQGEFQAGIVQIPERKVLFRMVCLVAKPNLKTKKCASLNYLIALGSFLQNNVRLVNIKNHLAHFN